MTMSYNMAMKKLDPKGESPRLILRVPPETLKALQDLAAKDRRTLSDYVRLVLQDHVQARTRERA
jgi:predicted DNA-binding protein